MSHQNERVKNTVIIAIGKMSTQILSYILLPLFTAKMIVSEYGTFVWLVYAPYKDIEYYETEVTISDNTLTSIASIDYENIDIDELIKIDSAYEQLFTNGKISIDTIENLYNQIGVSCTR